MARQKQVHKQEKLPKNTKEKSSVSRDDMSNNSSIGLTAKKILVAVIVTIAAYIAGKGYLETRVNTPLDDHRVSFS